MSEKEDAQLGRTMRHLGRFHGGALLTCVVLLAIFGERNQWSNWILATSLVSGVLIAIWLHQAEKKREAALQQQNDVVE